MDKMRAYIGLAAALALAVLVLYPVGRTHRYPMHATPLDNDLVSAAILSTSDTPKLMDRAYSTLYRCRDGREEQDSIGCGVNDIAPDLGYIYDNKEALSKFVPDIDKRLNAYFDDYDKNKNLESPILIALKIDIVKHYDELFAQYKTRYTIATYVVHVIILFLIGLMVRYRRNVGSFAQAVVTAPFGFAGKALAGIHKRI